MNGITSSKSAEGVPPGPSRRESKAERLTRAAAIAARLERTYPAAECSLDFKNPFQLLVATILSAQCTDKRVNMVTAPLFDRWPTPAALAAARPRDLEQAIRSTGFFRAKAKNILACCQALVERHGGEVPESLADLVKLPGVGRKTANVVLGTAFGRAEGVVVDTHVGRISRRLGLTRHADAVRAERDLVAMVPTEHWISYSHRLIEHGRAVCTARSPKCDRCALADLCPRVGVAPPAKGSRPKTARGKRRRP
jgi:endonuclease-3